MQSSPKTTHRSSYIDYPHPSAVFGTNGDMPTEKQPLLGENKYLPRHNSPDGADVQLPRHHPLGTYKWRAYVAEFVGTCLFMFLVESAAVASAKHNDSSLSPVLFAALVNGFGVVGVIYSLGPISGAHINPAITLATMIAKQLTITEGILYIIVQLAGGVCGTALVLLMHPDAADPLNGSLGLIKVAQGIDWERALFCEVILTFILVFIVFSVVLNPHVTVENVSSNAIAPLFAPIAVGFTVLSNIMAGYYISGVCMNPARDLGPILLTGDWTNASVFLIGPLIGSVLGVLFQMVMFGRDPYLKL